MEKRLDLGAYQEWRQGKGSGRWVPPRLYGRDRRERRVSRMSGGASWNQKSDRTTEGDGEERRSGTERGGNGESTNGREAAKRWGKNEQ